MSEEEDDDDDLRQPPWPTTEPTTDNPLDQMGVVLSFPRTVEIEMVEARDLGDYELWFGIVSILLSTTVGFLVSWLQAWQSTPPEKTAGVLLVITIVFGVLTVGSIAVAGAKRRRLSRERQRVTFKAGRLS